MCVCVLLIIPSSLQMDRGMIRGCDVHVAAASDENGYVELPPEAAKHPWAQIG